MHNAMFLLCLRQSAVFDLDKTMTVCRAPIPQGQPPLAALSPLVDKRQLPSHLTKDGPVASSQ